MSDYAFIGPFDEIEVRPEGDYAGNNVTLLLTIDGSEVEFFLEWEELMKLSAETDSEIKDYLTSE